jgi:hypothetical protein
MENMFTQIILMAVFGIGMCIVLPEFVFKTIERLCNFFRKHKNI